MHTKLSVSQIFEREIRIKIDYNILGLCLNKCIKFLLGLLNKLRFALKLFFILFFQTKCLTRQIMFWDFWLGNNYDSNCHFIVIVWYMFMSNKNAAVIYDKFISAYNFIVMIVGKCVIFTTYYSKYFVHFNIFKIEGCIYLAWKMWLQKWFNCQNGAKMPKSIISIVKSFQMPQFSS